MIILVTISSPASNQQVQGTGVPVLCTHVDGRPVSTQDTEAPKGWLSPNNNNREKLPNQGAEVTGQPGSLEPEERQLSPCHGEWAKTTLLRQWLGGYCPGDENFVNMCNDMCNELLKAEGGLLTQQSLELHLVDLILRPPHGSGESG